MALLCTGCKRRCACVLVDENTLDECWNGALDSQAGFNGSEAGLRLVGSLIDVALECAQRAIHVGLEDSKVSVVDNVFQTFMARLSVAVPLGMDVH